MNRTIYFKVQKLQKAFNKAMAEGNVDSAKEIHKQINILTIGREEL